ncbi:MAG: hypothetical protein ACJ8DC_05465 [Gemmatimonadales bacterium]
MRGRLAGLTLASVLWLTSAASAQQTCQVLRALGRGALLVRCGTDTLLAITDSMQKAAERADIEREGAVEKLAKKDTIIGTFERERALYDTTLARKNAYIAELEQLSDGYKKLASGYKKLSGEKNLTLEGGLGATGDGEPAVVAGVGIRRLRIWGFLQNHNSGGMIGLNFPLF